MGQLAGEIELPRQRRRPNFALVMPLIGYLDSLPDNGKERALSWPEDQQAIGILRSLVPEDNWVGQECVAAFTHQSCRKDRTLAGWYMMCKHVLEHLQGSDRCDCG